MPREAEEAEMSDLRTLVRAMTLIIAELVFVALICVFVIETWDAKPNTPPDLSGVQVSAAGALAVAFGAGYAALLGVFVTLRTRRPLLSVLTTAQAAAYGVAHGATLLWRGVASACVRVVGVALGTGGR